MSDDQRFLVYPTYELVPSATPELPPEPEVERLTELARQHPEGIGRRSAGGEDHPPGPDVTR